MLLVLCNKENTIIGRKKICYSVLIAFHFQFIKIKCVCAQQSDEHKKIFNEEIHKDII